MHTGEIEYWIEELEAERDDMLVKHENLSEDTITTHSICDGGESHDWRYVRNRNGCGRSEHV